MNKLIQDVKADPVGAFLYVLLVATTSAALAVVILKGCP